MYPEYFSIKRDLSAHWCKDVTKNVILVTLMRLFFKPWAWGWPLFVSHADRCCLVSSADVEVQVSMWVFGYFDPKTRTWVMGELVPWVWPLFMSLLWGLRSASPPWGDQSQLSVVTAAFLRQQCGPDPSEGAPAKHGGTDGCLLFSVQQKGQPAQRPGGPAQKPEGQQVGHRFLCAVNDLTPAHHLTCSLTGFMPRSLKNPTTKHLN